MLTRFQILYFVIVPWKWFTPRQRWRPSRSRLLRPHPRKGPRQPWPKNPVRAMQEYQTGEGVLIRSTTMLNCSFRAMVTERNHVRRFGWERDF